MASAENLGTLLADAARRFSARPRLPMLSYAEFLDAAHAVRERPRACRATRGRAGACAHLQPAADLAAYARRVARGRRRRAGASQLARRRGGAMAAKTRARFEWDAALRKIGSEPPPAAPVLQAPRWSSSPPALRACRKARCSRIARSPASSPRSRACSALPKASGRCSSSTSPSASASGSRLLTLLHGGCC